MRGSKPGLHLALVVAVIADVACGYPSLPRIGAGDDGGIDGATAICGNGVLEPGEECEDGDTIDGDGCDHNCTRTSCGNGIQTQGEDCDDGNRITESCPYGEGTCIVCNASCHLVNAFGPRCGDGHTDSPFEDCDDGNSTEGDGCSNACRFDFCGNGTIELPEACDDHNRLACGTCSADCTTTSNPAPATGRITAASGTDTRDGETFTLSDGFTTVTFTFFKGTPTTPPPHGIRADDGDSVIEVADRIFNAINGSGLLFSAGRIAASGVVTLTDLAASAQGNKPITETVASINFSVLGMMGGRAGDCSAGVGCKTNADCLSLRCDSTDHTCKACTADTQCSTNRCSSGQCLSCVADSMCAAGHPHCVSNACVDCIVDGECSSNRCVANVCLSCSNNNQCPTTNLCVAGVCTPCVMNNDCPSHSCTAGKCDP